MAKELIGSVGPSTPTQPSAPTTPGGPKKTFLTNINGKDGNPGENAYAIAVENGFEGTEIEWLESLDGVDGTDAYGIALLEGFIGTRAEWLASLRGKSAYELAVIAGYEGTLEEWLEFLEGDDGESAYASAVADGFTGTKQEWLISLRGLSAYQLAVLDGYSGSLSSWLISLKGDDGQSAFEAAQEDGFTGTKEEWIDSLEGLDGEDGWTPTLSRTATHLQLQYVRDDEEQPPFNLLALSDITGKDGYTPGLSRTATHIQVSYIRPGEAATPPANLISLDEIKGKDAVLPTIGATAKTVAYGQPAKMSTSIDPDTGLLLFSAEIPAGKDGNNATNPAFTVTSENLPSTSPATASLTGTYPNLTLALGLRQGNPGVQGPSSPETNTYVRYGNGSPVNVVSAPVGTTWTDLMQTNGAKRWFKASGTGTAGWVIDEGDTGWIQVGNIQNSANTNTTSSYIEIRRINNEVYVSGFHQKTAVNGLNVFHVPTGFWPINGVNQTPRQVGLYARDQAGTTVFYMEWNWYQAFGAYRGFGGGTNTTLTRALLISGSYATTQPWPDVLAWT